MCPGKKRKTWWYQSYRWFKRSVRNHIRAQMAFVAVYGTFLLEERRWYIIYDIVILNYLFVVDWFPCLFPGSLRKALNIQQTHQYLYKKNNNNNNNRTYLKAVVCLLELFVYIQLLTWTRLSSNAKFGNAQFEPACIETPPVFFICLFCRRQVNLK